MKVQKNILIIAGLIGLMLGIVGAIPSFLQEKLAFAVLFSILIVLGLILLAIGFGD